MVDRIVSMLEKLDSGSLEKVYHYVRMLLLRPSGR